MGDVSGKWDWPGSRGVGKDLGHGPLGLPEGRVDMLDGGVRKVSVGMERMMKWSE